MKDSTKRVYMKYAVSCLKTNLAYQKNQARLAKTMPDWVGLPPEHHERKAHALTWAIPEIERLTRKITTAD